MSDKIDFDIVVVGGGHAGVEATWISAQLGCSICLITLPDVGIASMPCNPSIGGVGKGQVVREIDALGGLMGRLADLAGIQYRILNQSKGFAVQSTRVQADKEKYSEYATQILSNQNNVTILKHKIISVTKNEENFSIVTNSGQVVTSKSLIVTTGTFLNGKLHRGPEQFAGGRDNCSASSGLTDIFGEIKLRPKRFKTGTPPRIKKETINFEFLSEQDSDPKTLNFHCLNEPHNRNLKQVPCFLTRMNSETMQIIRENKEKSPIYNGQIKGIGPRYCPSIEDKAFRYEDRNSHHIFLEPEGLESNSYYPSGISTSLPKEVQDSFLRTIKGFEAAEILIYGYAVEYDVIDTTSLCGTLEHKDIEGLYFAGQVNGTSGYEEAAGQGLIAGANAALKIKDKNPLVLSRYDSYIGVMIEDLVTTQRDEPYRLFTARAENRLYIREDNSLLRMFSYRKSFGLKQELDQFLEQFEFEYKLLSDLVNKTTFKSSELEKAHFNDNQYGSLEQNTSFNELLRRANVNPICVLTNECRRFNVKFMDSVINCVAISAKYDGYIKRSQSEGEKLRKLNEKRIDWEALYLSKNISFECKERIKKHCPENFYQLQAIEGIRPVTLAYVAGVLV